MFIQLTQFVAYTKDALPTRPVWVNTDNITYFNSWKRLVTKYGEPLDENNRVPVEEKVLTVISFAAGLQEESDSITVTETPEEILRAIGFHDGVAP